jgi:membrane fusion protein (multidrug efflux system)
LLPIAVAAAWSLVACDQNAGGSTKATAPQKLGAAAVQGTTPPAVTVAPVTRKDMTPSADFVGRVTPIDKVDLVARVQGFLEKRLFTEGRDVKTGDLLFLIEPDIYDATVQQQEANLASAQANATNATLQLMRGEELLKNNNIPRAQVDQLRAAAESAQAAVKQAEAALRQAKINLGYSEIRAPIDGRIGLANVTIGNLVGPTSGTLATIVSQDPIYVIFQVSERQILDYRRQVAAQGGDAGRVTVHLTLADGSAYPQTGTVDFLDIQVEPSTDTVAVRAELPNPQRLLVAGQFATVTAESGVAQPALLIPQAAIQVDQAGSYVLVVGPDHKVEVRRIATGAQQGGDIIVTDGLKDGEQVIVEGMQKVHPGDVVAPSTAARA